MDRSTDREKLKADEVRRAIRIEMVRRKIGAREIAAATNYAEGTIFNVIEGSNKSKPIRDAIEKFFARQFWNHENDNKPN